MAEKWRRQDKTEDSVPTAATRMNTRARETGNNCSDENASLIRSAYTQACTFAAIAKPNAKCPASSRCTPSTGLGLQYSAASMK